ncbi:unnamed protein product [Lactuca saligna]|uniref:Uncharacterized protein n=1 Tax=Lactuca saligna TaxID=75948 RepID=A0AA36DZF0_LACSI|nr:unnamed protein product [Lactuca saligna]
MLIYDHHHTIQYTITISNAHRSTTTVPPSPYEKTLIGMCLQLFTLKYVVSAPPEVFTFAHCERQVAFVDAVNTPKFQSGYANHAWLCLDLLEHCPKVFLYGMAHVNAPYNVLQHEVSLVVLLETEGE